ncbi:MAG: hypothetical protein LC804_10820, partial [Acidobacteria bacterium]|nr:hypothetical protein [Acidobacteriota bacterium]
MFIVAHRGLACAMLMLCAAGGVPQSKPGGGSGERVTRIERLDPALDRLIASGAEVQTLAEGYDWSEGPVWVRDGRFLLFSDVPRNVIH